ncbi:MAG: ComEC/Rec2 family competence protein [Flavobacteriaceae bacterium]
MQSLKIYHQINYSIDAISTAESTGFSFLKYRAFLLKKLDQSRLKPQTIAILKTILLGERNSLDNYTREEFAKAGVVHLFAISGLHVGLLMLFFQILFRPLSSFPKGKLWQNTVIRPSFIQQLGFQMSYLAVFGILFLSPLFALNIRALCLF